VRKGATAGVRCVHTPKFCREREQRKARQPAPLLEAAAIQELRCATATPMPGSGHTQLLAATPSDRSCTRLGSHDVRGE